MDRRVFSWKFILGNTLIVLAGIGLAVGHILDPLFHQRALARTSFFLFMVFGGAGVFLLASSILDISKIARRLSLLADMSLEINRAILLNEDIDFIYGTILNYLFRIFAHVKYGSVLILDDEGYLTFAAARGFTDGYRDNFRLRLEESFLWQDTGGNITGARLISRRTLDKWTMIKPELWEYKSVISAPMYIDGRLFGLLNLDSSRPKTFARADVHIVEQFTSQIEVCLLARGRYRHSIERSRQDALTNLFTRRYFEELFQLEIARAERYGESFVLALFDADGLKKANDTFGHQAGDRMLIAIADALREGHRKTDIIGRYGGDEYIAVYHSADMESIRKNLAEIRAKLCDEPLEIGDDAVQADFSFGLARFPEDGKNLNELTAAADSRLYEMKKRRR